MASQSGSAVLDLQDDLEDTDGADTLTDGTADDSAPPLFMERGYDIAVKVDAPQKQLSTLETYVTYRVRCACARWPATPPVRRRYNHFKVLHARLSAQHTWLAPPPPPPLHSARQQLDRYSTTFVAVRTLALDAFLNRVAKHPILTHSEDFRIFLTAPNDEIDKVFKSENSALNLWGLSSALYGGGETKPVNGARVKDPEFSSATDYLQSLQQKLTTLCALTTKLYKGSSALGAEYKGLVSWSRRWADNERGLSRSLSCLSDGAIAASRSRSGPTAIAHRAVLPLLAAHAAAHLDKIRLRDGLHAAYVAGTNNTDEVHNRLEQASEALRSELTDWTTKTRADTKSILLDIAEKQLLIHQQSLMGWEQALKVCTRPDPSAIFKTVSKIAVQNLSPTKSLQNPLEEPTTEKDLEDLDLENCSNDDSDLQDLNSRLDVINATSVTIDLSESVSDVENVKMNLERTDSSSLQPETEDSRAVTSDPLQSFAEIDLNEDSHIHKTMASQSGSAVLDLQDDLEDTDGADTLTDGTADDSAPPLFMERGYDIAVKVDAPQKQLSTLETYVTYRVRCACARWPATPPVRRRYNHFKVLHARLSAQHTWLAPPPPPPLHSARQQLDRYSTTFVAVRTLALDAFLNRVAKHPILTHSEDFRIFLTAPNDEIDKVFKSENSALNLWGLSSALYGGGETKPVNGARVKDPEFSSATDYLQSLQQKLTTLCALTTKLYKGSSALGAEYKGLVSWSRRWADNERGLSRSLSCLSDGAIAASRSRSGPTAIAHRAVLPLLAAHAAAHLDKIRLRDGLHAAYVAGTNNTDEVHNRLEQASEALRSELTDWTTKTRADTKSILLDIAEKQLLIHQQSLMGWEQALKVCTRPDPSAIFKTVSKIAVQNLSPTKSLQNPLEEPTTEKDLEDLDLENCSNDDSDLQDLNSRLDVINATSVTIDLSESVSDVENVKMNLERTDSSSLQPETEDSRAVTSDPLQSFAEIDLNEDS